MRFYAKRRYLDSSGKPKESVTEVNFDVCLSEGDFMKSMLEFGDYSKCRRLEDNRILVAFDGVGADVTRRTLTCFDSVESEPFGNAVYVIWNRRNERMNGTWVERK